MKDYKELLSDHSETWQQAIDRYIRFTETDMKDYFSPSQSYLFKDNESYQYHNGTPYSQVFIDKFEADHKHHIPTDLAQLLSTRGAFTIGKGLFTLFPESTGFLNLSQVLDMFNMDNVTQRVSLNVLESINQYYYFFGVSFPQTDEVSFLFFDKAGHLGKMYVHVENIDLTIKKTLPSLFSGKVDHYTLDTLMGMAMDRVITNALIVKGYIKIE